MSNFINPTTNPDIWAGEELYTSEHNNIKTLREFLARSGSKASPSRFVAVKAKSAWAYDDEEDLFGVEFVGCEEGDMTATIVESATDYDASWQFVSLGEVTADVLEGWGCGETDEVLEGWGLSEALDDFKANPDAFVYPRRATAGEGTKTTSDSAKALVAKPKKTVRWVKGLITAQYAVKASQWVPRDLNASENIAARARINSAEMDVEEEAEIAEDLAATVGRVQAMCPLERGLWFQKRSDEQYSNLFSYPPSQQFEFTEFVSRDPLFQSDARAEALAKLTSRSRVMVECADDHTKPEFFVMLVIASTTMAGNEMERAGFAAREKRRRFQVPR